MVNENDWRRFYLHVYSAADGIQDDEEERYAPSPSGIAGCRLRQWFQGVGHPKTNRFSVEATKNMAQGTATEGFWRDVYTRAGFDVVSPMRRPAEGSMGAMQSHGGDGFLYVATQECAEALGMKIGTKLLLELKNFGAWSYFDFILKGIEEGHPNYWMQTQVYMHGYGVDYTVFHAGIADPSGSKWIWKRIKKQSDDLPPFWMEVIPKDDAVIMKALEKASDIQWHKENVTDRIPIELRDYDVNALLPEGKFPCGYCPYADACIGRSRPKVHESSFQYHQY
jgi:hypothetical protein